MMNDKEYRVTINIPMVFSVYAVGPIAARQKATDSAYRMQLNLSPVPSDYKPTLLTLDEIRPIR